MKLEQNALQGIADLIVRGPQGSSGRTVTRLEEFFSNCGVGGFEYHPQTTKKLAVRRLLTSINGTEMMEVVLEAMMQPVYFDPTDPVGVPNRQSKFLDELNIWLQSSRVRMTITNDVVTFHRPGESPIAQTGEDMSYWHFSIGLEDGSTAEEYDMSKSDMQDKILKSWYSEKPILVSGSVIHRSARDSAKTLFLFETPMPSTHYAEGMRARNRRNRISVFGQDYRRLVFQEGTEHTELLFDQPPPEQDSRVLSDIEVFVSHAAHDAELTAAFVRLITTAIGIPDEAVRCTSVPKYKLKPGENSADTLRNDIQSCNVFIGVVTPRSMQRPFVLMEMGAAWAFNKTVIPLLAEDAQWSDVPSPFAGIHGVEASDRDGLVDLIESVTGALDYPAPTTKRVNAEISFFLKHLENR